MSLFVLSVWYTGEGFSTNELPLYQTAFSGALLLQLKVQSESSVFFFVPQ